ncbi:MAG TPA: right-handed parallel beta-helix repeat-containing protein [Bryobacteraceae bacterium]|nr:right-handed parallel beta-helix repeat-containing protein [Bryobacteraceae bacterium]
MLPRVVNAQVCQLYVSPAGSDTNAGTLSAPWRTVQHAFNYAQPGERICFRGGIYPRTSSTAYSQSLTRSGTSTSHITFTNYPGEVAIIEGSTRIDAAYVTFQGTPVTAPGLIFSGPGATNMDLVDLMYSHDVTFDHVEIRNGAYHAGLYQYGGYNIRVTGCYIHDNGRPGYINTDQGIYWDATAGSGNLIANNVVEHNVAMGVQLYPAPVGVVVEENTIVNNGNYGIVVYGSLHKIVNNILSNNGNSATNPQMKIDSLSSFTIDSNIFWSSNTRQQGYWDLCACHPITHSIIKNPMLVNPGSHLYGLLVGSPAISVGNSGYTMLTNKIGITRTLPPNLGAY